MAGAVGPVSIEFDRTGFVRVVPPIDPSGPPIAVSAEYTTEPVMIGDTGLVITASGLGLSLDSDDPTISVTSARLLLPPRVSPDVVLPELTFADAVVGWHGFSGTLTAEWDLTVVGGEVRYTGTDPADGGPSARARRRCLGSTAGSRGIAVRLTDSAPEALGMAGKLRLPFFDDVVDIELGVDGTGGLSVRVAGADDGALGADPRGLVHHACRVPRARGIRRRDRRDRQRLVSGRRSSAARGSAGRRSVSRGCGPDYAAANHSSRSTAAGSSFATRRCSTCTASTASCPESDSAGRTADCGLG